MGDRYPQATWAPWKYHSPDGQPTYFAGTNKPAAVVLHIQAGYAHTAVEWAAAGHYGASWHYTVARDGHVFQHLDHEDGGYQAGSFSSPPVWPLWRGHAGGNINNYTIGIEHEGFPGEPFTALQASASAALCRWLSFQLHIPFDRVHFPPHRDIDTVNRPNDFNEPALREAHYAYLFQEDDLTDQEREDLKNLVAIMGGSAKLKDNADRGNDFILGYTLEQQKLGEHIADKDAHK